MSICWSIESFASLTPKAVYDIFKLRQDVFILEQACLYPDFDGKDSRALHLMGYSDAALAAYARLFAPNDYFPDHVAFGRVATAAAFRGQGLGKALLSECLQACSAHWPGVTIEISGQCYLQRFYESFGFQTEGEPYLEDNLPHQRFLLGVTL